jgi:hypothetical protein
MIEQLCQFPLLNSEDAILQMLFIMINKDCVCVKSTCLEWEEHSFDQH